MNLTNPSSTNNTISSTPMVLNAPCIDCHDVVFNPSETNCSESSSSSSPSGSQVFWSDILDKPICFPACLAPLENLFVPLTRTITINGETHDLATDRTWTVNLLTSLSATSPLLYNNLTGVFSIQQATTVQNGYLSSTDWNIFNNKQNALGFTPENVANKSISTSLGTSNILYPTQLAVKTYVDAAVSGFFILQGDWNASTNSPDLTGVITTGFAWRVSVAGSTNLGGITDWQVNDVAAKTATGWIKFDNSNSVTSVNGYTGAVVLTTTEISEGTNLYYTNARGIGSLLTGYTSGAGTITSADSVLSAIQKLNGNALTSTATTGFIPKMSSATSFTNSIMSESAGLVTVSGNLYTSGSNRIDMNTFGANTGFIARLNNSTGLAGIQFWDSSNTQKGYLAYSGPSSGSFVNKIVLASTAAGIRIDTGTTSIDLRTSIALMDIVGAINQSGGTVQVMSTDSVSTTNAFKVIDSATNDRFLATSTGNISGLASSSVIKYFLNTNGESYVVDGFRLDTLAGTGTRLPSISSTGLFGVASGTGFLKLTGSVVSFDNSTYVPTSTTLGFNGVVQSLAANRTWRTGLADTGVLTYGGISVASATTVNIGAVTGVIVDNETNPLIPTFTNVTYAGATGVTVTTIGSGTGTYVLLNSSGTIVFQNTFPTSAQRKTMIYLSKISHPNLTSISFAIDEVDFITSPLAQFRDLFQAIVYINTGVTITPNAALTIANTAGTILGDGIYFVTDKTRPNNLPVASSALTSFLVVNQTGATGGFTTAVDVANYDVAGVTTAIGGGTNRSTLQYLYYASGVGFAFQRGQTVYANLNDAIAAVGRESFVIRPNLVGNSILIGVFAFRHTTTNLSDTNFARFFPSDKFGQAGGSSSGISTATFQSTYNNTGAITAKIITSLANDGIAAQVGVEVGQANTDIVWAAKNQAGTTTWSVNGLGNVTGNSFIKTGGISSQFLKADGSVDSSTYITSSASSGFVPYMSTATNLANSTISMSGGNVMVASDVTLSTINGGLILNRPATSNYIGTILRTATVGKWFVGLRENLTSDNYIVYSEVTGTDALTINVATNEATFSNALRAGYTNGVYLNNAGTMQSRWYQSGTNVIFDRTTSTAFVWSLAGTPQIELASSGAIKFNSYISGALSSDGSGNITSGVLSVANGGTGVSSFSNDYGLVYYHNNQLLTAPAVIYGNTPGVILLGSNIVQGKLFFQNGSGSFQTVIKPSSSTSANWDLTLPVNAGTSGYALTTDGSGVTSWSDLGGIWSTWASGLYYNSGVVIVGATTSDDTTSKLQALGSGGLTSIAIREASIFGTASYLFDVGTTGTNTRSTTPSSIYVTRGNGMFITSEGQQGGAQWSAPIQLYTHGTQRIYIGDDFNDLITLNTAITQTKNFYPLTDNTYYLGKNSASTPFAWKGVILKDTTNGNYYRIEIISGVVTATVL